MNAGDVALVAMIVGGYLANVAYLWLRNRGDL